MVATPSVECKPRMRPRRPPVSFAALSLAAVHEVDARMKSSNAPATIFVEATGVPAAQGRGMARAADALSTNPAIARGRVPPGVALITARRRFDTASRARRNFNVHAHADRRAPPGGDPGRGDQGKPDRGV